MAKLKCWKKEYSNETATNWSKKGKYTNETLRPMIDVRRYNQNSNDFHLETYDIGGGRKFSERITGRARAEKRAIQIMKKHDKCPI